MAIFFLELDDEITSAVGRLRGVSDPSVALVLPAGSRIASSRINFRLLAREASARGARLAIIAPEPPARALAIAAGLPAYGTVREYEAALAGGDGRAAETALAEIPTAPGGAQPTETTERVAPGGGAGVAAGAGAGSRAAEQATESALLLPVARGRRRFALSLPGPAAFGAAVAVMLALGVGAAAAYFVLPEARVTLVPRVEAFGPLTFQLTADTNATQVDPSGGVVPATWVDVPVQAQGTFPATGLKVTETKATGSVTFSNRDIKKERQVPGGSTVKTAWGVAFTTAQAITVPKARVQQDANGNLILVPGTASVPVEAVKEGTSGNVAANTITVIPPGYDPAFLKVTNPQKTSGGTHIENKVVKQSDYDAAVKALSDQLLKSFDQELASGSAVAESQFLVPSSGTVDPATFQPDAATIVGSQVGSFDLSAQATGHVVAVDRSSIDAIGLERLRTGSLPPGYVLFEQTVKTDYRALTSPEPSKPLIEVTSQGQAYRQLDPAALKAQILGKSIAEARTILSTYGDPSIELIPDWFGTIPRFDWRVTIEVRAPSAAS